MAFPFAEFVLMPFVVHSSAPWTFVFFSIQTRKRQAVPEINRLVLSCLLHSLALQLQSAKSSFGMLLSSYTEEKRKSVLLFC